MKIYSEVLLDMKTGQELAAIWEEYDGEVALCKGGGGTEVDKEYNARMATIAEAQQAQSDEYFKFWQEYTRPYEQAQTLANQEMLPYETALYKQQIQSATNLVPQQEQIASAYYSDALKGVDVNQRIGAAAADVSAAWKDAQAENERTNARMGVNPNSGRFQGTQAALETEKAAQMAGARTQARVDAENENFNRRKEAANLNAASGIMQGITMQSS